MACLSLLLCRRKLVRQVKVGIFFLVASICSLPLVILRNRPEPPAATSLSLTKELEWFKNTTLPNNNFGHAVIEMKKYRFSYCPIMKSMMSVGMGIMCYLATADAAKFKSKYGSIYRDHWLRTACAGMTYKRKLEAKALAVKDWEHMAIVREPVERLVSGWLDKCVRAGTCLGCGTDFPCFLERVVKQIYARFKDPAWLSKLDRAISMLLLVRREKEDLSNFIGMPEEAFLKHVAEQRLAKPAVEAGKKGQARPKNVPDIVYPQIKAEAKVDEPQNKKSQNKNSKIVNVRAKRVPLKLSSFSDRDLVSALVNYTKFGDHVILHYYPQSWFCDLTVNHEKFTLLKYSREAEFYESLLKFLKRKGVVGTDITTLRKELIGGRTSHSTFDFEQRNRVLEEIENSKELQEVLYRMYIRDYQLFGFEPPFGS